jgi:hypothetical protein
MYVEEDALKKINKFIFAFLILIKSCIFTFEQKDKVEHLPNNTVIGKSEISIKDQK